MQTIEKTKQYSSFGQEGKAVFSYLRETGEGEKRRYAQNGRERRKDSSTPPAAARRMTEWGKRFFAARRMVGRGNGEKIDFTSDFFRRIINAIKEAGGVP